VKYLTISGLLLLAIVSSIHAQESGSYPDSRERVAWQEIDAAAYGEGWLTLDRNEDGTTDYAVRVNDRGYKLTEAVDFNYDGAMDDFYFYSNDVLQRQEIDSNYDGEIDIWIYLRRGVYIRMWERDNDFDGIIDERQEYGSGT
jgi:hypothetical protein